MKRFLVPLMFALSLLAGLCAPLVLVPSRAQVSRTFVQSGTTKPASCSNKAMLFHLTQTDGSNAPGLYRCNGSAYVFIGGSGTVTGTGTTGKLPKFSNGAGGVLGDSLISDDGSTVTINGAAQVSGRLATFSLNVNSVVYQTLYTVPTGKSLVLERLVYRGPTNNQSTTNFQCQNSATTTLLTSGTMPTLITATKFGVQAFQTSDTGILDSEILAAGASLQCKPTTAIGSAATVTVDVFGYLF